MKKKSKKVYKNSLNKNFATCSAKKFFKSENEAKKACDMQNLISLNTETYHYKCLYCKGWHMSTKNA